MPSHAPSYGSQEYWEHRFHNDSGTFDWLADGHVLDESIRDALKNITDPIIFHIGCGTSALSGQLRKYVRKPRQIHNLDFAHQAIDLGRQADLKDLKQTNPSWTEEDCMRWSAGDLLDLSLIEREFEQSHRDGAPYDLIIDKSTTDSISCAEDVIVSLPYSLCADSYQDSPRQASVHPVNVLAVHMAALTPPSSGRWICLSYSSDRFRFLIDDSKTGLDGLLVEDHIPAGFPDPKVLWRLEKKYPVQAFQEPHPDSRNGPMHRPEVRNWLYILRRTEESVSEPSQRIP
ncbi:hypothetical protein NA57DRAFT_48959 [Rhizodiscina lignyota]|uniref:Methyltransferase domain-containing protein n=1 Tax=Rhizodiscina lignyota TaxID=1504668 RepID=A0A9P4I3H6_9PEZI|nr:hypothetical protein NA57DRAFT_48959 [Rhizodiscina lignyota]